MTKAAELAHMVCSQGGGQVLSCSIRGVSLTCITSWPCISNVACLARLMENLSTKVLQRSCLTATIRQRYIPRHDLTSLYAHGACNAGDNIYNCAVVLVGKICWAVLLNIPRSDTSDTEPEFQHKQPPPTPQTDSAHGKSDRAPRTFVRAAYFSVGAGGYGVGVL